MQVADGGEAVILDPKWEVEEYLPCPAAREGRGRALGRARRR